MKNVQIFYNCAFCRAGILVCLESDHVRRGRQGYTHIFFPGVATPQSSSVVRPHLQIKHCAAQSHSYFCFDTWFALPFHPGMFSFWSPWHPTLPRPASFLPEMSEVRTLSFGTWEFGGIFWHYRAAFVPYHAISCYTITVTV